MAVKLFKSYYMKLNKDIFLVTLTTDFHLNLAGYPKEKMN